MDYGRKRPVEPIFEQKTYWKVWHRDLEPFLDDVCGRPYDVSRALVYPANGSMEEIDTTSTPYTSEDREAVQDWLNGDEVDEPPLDDLLHVLAERENIPHGTYLINVWW